jgi:hypothetical protein
VVAFPSTAKGLRLRLLEATPLPGSSPANGTGFVSVPAGVVEAAKASLRATIVAGNPLSVNQLQERFSLTRRAATEVRNDVLAESNGHRSM